MLTTDETAIRIDPTSEEEIVVALAAHMDRLAEDANYATALAIAGFKAARENFDWSSVAEQWQRASGEMYEDFSR